MKKTIATLIFSFAFLAPARAQWEQTSGPSITFSEDTTQAYSIAAINGTIFVGTVNGVLKSADSGQTWTNIFDSTGCYGITAVGTNLFVGYSGDGSVGEVFRSTDEGQTWSKTPGQIRGAAIVNQLTSNDGVLFAGARGANGPSSLYRSTNGGTSWDSIVGLWVFTDYITGCNSRVFAGSEFSGDSCYQSTDTGATWESFVIAGSHVRSVGASANFVLAKTESQAYYSTDNGSNWSVASGVPSPEIYSIVVNGNTLFAGFSLPFGSSSDEGIYQSTNGGSSWTPISRNISIQIADPNGVLLFGNKIFACNPIYGGGILVTSDDGSQWNDAATVQLTSSLDVHSLSIVGSKIIAGTGDSGIYVTSNDGSNWNQSGLSGRTVYSLLSTGSSLFAGTDGGSADTSGGIFLSTDTGTRWTSVLNGLANVNALAASSGNLYAGTDSDIYASTNSGTNWSPVFSHVHVNTLAAQGSKVFAGTSANGLITSTNNGTSWSANNGTLPITDVQSLAVKGGILFAGTNGNGLFLSTDTGQSWTDVSSGLPASSVLSLEENSQQFFAGTAGDGIFRTDDSGKTWKQVDSGLVNLNVTSLGIRNGNLFAGTIGGGVWERPLSQMLIVEPASVTQTTSTLSEIHIYPNPFTQSTQITFTSPSAGYAEVSIVNMLGVEVVQLFSGEVGAGEHNFSWSNPAGLQDGVYECLVRMNGQVDDRSSTMQTLPVVLMR